MKTFISVLAAGGIILGVFFGVQAHQRSQHAKDCEHQRVAAAVYADAGESYPVDASC